MSTSAESAVLCTICKSEGVLLCVQCRSVHYCSKECQRTDWRTHKLLCRSFNDFHVAPGPTFRRAILFPVEEKSPRFIWVEDRIENYDEDMDLEHLADTWQTGGVQLGGLLGPGDSLRRLPLGRDPILSANNFDYNRIRDRHLENRIRVVYRDSFTTDGSLPNQSISEVTRGKQGYKWAGPIIAFRMKEIPKETMISHPHDYCDITLEDFRHLVDYFVTYKNKC